MLSISVPLNVLRLTNAAAFACFSLAWTRKKAAYAADIGIAGLFTVAIALLVIDPDRFTARLAGMMMFHCGGRLD